ncbi:MAG: right-handed parallel beta-helix repeat-containing protein [Candidatus Zixiibacteriota bacterium]
MKLVIAFLLAMALMSVSFGATIHVPADQPTIQAGINVAVDGDTVLVADGHYYELLRIEDKNICLASQMIVDQDTSHIAATIIDGDTAVVGVSDSNSVIRCYSGMTLFGLTVTGGLGTSNSIRYGGGIWAMSMSLLIKHCRLFGNHADVGSAAYFAQAHGTFDHCNISGNAGMGTGIRRSAVYAGFGGASLDSCQILDNGGDGVGGVEADFTFDNVRIEGNAGYGVYINGGHLWHMWDCVISNNGGGLHWAGTGGGKVRRTPDVLKDAVEVIVNSVITNNGGRGIYFGDMAGGSVRSSIVSGNGEGGIVVHPDGAALLFDCILVNNSAQYGGAVHLGGDEWSGYFEADRCLFDNNSAQYGGAIAWSGNGHLVLRSCTFIHNDALGGSVLYRKGVAPTEWTRQQFQRCIIAQNQTSPPFDCGFYGDSGVVISCTDIFGNPAGNWVDCIADQAELNGNFSADPQFCEAAAGNFGIRSTSPCAPANNTCSTLIGAAPVLCEPGIIHAPERFPTIQAAIDAAYDGDTVLVADGVYYERISFKGKKIVVASNLIMDGDTNHIANTIIDADTTVLGASDTGSVVRFVNGEDTNAVLYGLTVRNGVGGGILASSGVRIARCIINSNSGGGVRVTGGSYVSRVHLDSCAISNNIGGGVNGGYLEVRDCSITANQGGGVSTSVPTSVHGCIISNNVGSGISLASDECVISNCQIERNTGAGIFSFHYGYGQNEFSSCLIRENAEDGIHGGPSFYVHGGKIEFNGGYGLWVVGDGAALIDCDITHNGAGGIFVGGFPGIGLLVDGCNILFNTGVDGGGVHFGLPSSLMMRNSLVMGNTAVRGGAVWANGIGFTEVENCAFIANSADTGSFVAVQYSSGDTASFDRCAIIGNQGGSTIHVGSGYDTALAFGCSDIYGNDGGDWVGFIAEQANLNGNFSADPLFCDTSYTNLAVHSASPCLPANNSCSQLIGGVTLGTCQGPQVQSVIIPPNSQNVVSDTPTIHWDYSDDMNRTQSQFEIAVGSDTNWTYAELWNPAPFTSSDTFVVYNGSPLLDGMTYYLRLRVFNGAVWSPWYNSSFRMNSLPSVPVQQSPINNQVAGSLPTLWVLNSTDAEGDALTYDFAGFHDTDCVSGGPPIELNNVPSGIDSTGGQITTPLAENCRYWWRVRAFDGYEYSEWSPYANFFVDGNPAPPGAFTLTSPPDTSGLPVFTMLPTMLWQPSYDPDPFDTVWYKLELSDRPNFSFAYVRDSILTNQFALTDSLYFATHYYWRVTARDRTGLSVMSPTADFWTWALGDIDHSHACDIGDLSRLVDFLFFVAPISPLFVADVNGSCAVDISDLSYLIDYLFFNGPAPRVGC